MEQIKVVRVIKPISDRHSPPARKSILDKTPIPPEKIVPVHIVNIGGK